MNVLRLPVCVRKRTALLLSLLLVLEAFSGLLQAALFALPTAAAAPVVIDGAPNIDPTTHTSAGSRTVFVSDQVGYHFYPNIANTDDCRYRKTVNGGASWGPSVVVDNQLDCIGIVVWYDQWTPGDTGTRIHILTMDTGDDDLFYNSLDTSNDTLATTTSQRLYQFNASTTASFAGGTNNHSITKGTDGTLYAVADDGTGTGSMLRRCSSNCTVSANWSDVGTKPQGNADSWSMLMPLLDDEIMLINRSTGNLLRYSVWNGSLWSSFQNIDATAIRGTIYDVNMAATLDTDSGDLYLAYVADADSFTVADHDIRTARYSGGSWTNTTDVVTNTTRGIHQVAISRDQNTGTLYLAYAARTTLGTPSTANVFWHLSTTSMSTWGAENGPIATAGDFYAINMNLMSYERIYASWYDNVVAVRDTYGETIADIGPEVEVSATGTQVANVRAETNNFYVGGTFVVDTIATRTISTVTITETGTVDGNADLDNIRLYYEYDSSAPYNCNSESYAGSETPFGATETNGFSGANGIASFNITPLSITPTQTLCLYPVVDVLPTANDLETIQIEITDPSVDVVVSDVTPYPETPIRLPATTTIADPTLTLGHYHWRNDDGNETGATSATAGAQDTPIPALQKATPRRLRLGVSVEGSTSTLPLSFALEYGTAAPTCEAISTWTQVSSSALWNMYDSSNLTNAGDTTNIATSTGGVADENTVFLTPNGGVRDTTATTGVLTLATNNFVELEYSITASSTTVEGETYCFRVTRSGVPLAAYSVYPQATIAADVAVTATGTQATTTDVGATDNYLGGTYRLIENTSSRSVTSITLSENGSVDAALGLTNVRLRYDLDTSAPYNCASESYGGSEAAFGGSENFSGPDGTAVFTDSVAITTTSVMCLYVIYDVTTGAAHNETVNIFLNSPASDVVVSGGGSVGPSTPADVTGSTTLRGGVLTQTNYHWRLDNGTETTASSATNGLENAPRTDVTRGSRYRLRLGISNEGPTSSTPTQLQLEYGLKITTCANVSVWTDVGTTSDAWDMYDSTFLTEGDDTTNIGTSTGGVSDENTTFKTPNGGVRDTTSRTGTTTFTSSEHTDVEFSITSSNNTAFDTTYCFRLSASGVPLPTYTNYAELTMAPKRDFKIQRGVTTMTAATSTITAGVDYEAPSSTSRAFIRITNNLDTGAGRNTGGTTQNTDDVTAHILNPTNLLTSITFARPSTSINNTRVSWEIIEYIGEAGADNEMLVRGVGTVDFQTASTVASSSVISGVASSSDVVVFVTGSRNRGTTVNYYASQFTSEWSSSSNRAVFRRGATATTLADLSYAVVEFTGANWSVQRVEHQYGTTTVAETKDIEPVPSLSKAFVYAQKRLGAQANVINLSHEVWLSSIGAVSFQLQSGASLAITHTSVAWVVSNTQSGGGAMSVQRRNGNTSGGTAPLSLSVTIPDPIEATNNASILANGRAGAANTTHPPAHTGFRITSTTTFEIWRTDTALALTYRAEIVEWPVSDIGIRQNYYRFYVHNNAVTPTDPWPPGAADLGDNAPLTVTDEPLARGEQIRLRMTARISNDNMPAGFREFKLQYGLRTTGSCTAIETWTDLGSATSSAIWRGFSATGTTDGVALGSDPAGDGELLIPAVADVLGRLVHQNPASANPYAVDEGEDVEYDWHIEHNGAAARANYCFRMVLSDDTPLDGYLQYPQLRTAGYNPVTQNWRWYSDYLLATPTTTLAAENVAPTNITNTTPLALRLAVGETKNATGTDIRFRLQFSDDIAFRVPMEVVASSSCTANSLWCYVDGALADHATTASSTLSDAASCTAGVGGGCGRQVSSATYYTGHTHPSLTVQEHSFTIRHAGARAKAVYYFRLYDTVNDTVVPLGTGESYPSLVTEGPTVSLGVVGLASGTTTAGIVTDVAATPEGIAFGSLPLDTDYEAAHRLNPAINATEGYQVLFYARQQLMNSSGDIIAPITATNSAPVAWATGCPTSTSTGCIAYHTTDGTLFGGSTRFAPNDSYAGLSTTPQEIMYSSLPTSDTHDVIYRVRVGELQPAGDYETEIVYLIVPVY